MRVISKQATYVQQHHRSVALQEHLGSRSRVREIQGTSGESGRRGSPDHRLAFLAMRHSETHPKMSLVVRFSVHLHPSSASNSSALL